MGPAVGGYTSFSRGLGRGGIKGPQPPRGPPPNSGFGSDRQNPGLQPGMVMTPMGPMLAPMAMQMGFGGGGMDFHPHMMGAGGMSNPMMGMNMHGMEQMVRLLQSWYELAIVSSVSLWGAQHRSWNLWNTFLTIRVKKIILQSWVKVSCTPRWPRPTPKRTALFFASFQANLDLSLVKRKRGS